MEFMTTKEAVQKWNISERRIRRLLQDGRIEGAVKVGNNWNIPINANKPADKRSVKLDNIEFKFDLPDNYAMYVRSDSFISRNYKSPKALDKPVVTPNALIKQDDVDNVINAFYNQHSILPNPMVVLESTSYDSPYLRVITDSYTTIDYVGLTYCCQPNAFNVLKYNDNDDSAGAVHSYCQLPYSCFDELVSGAVDMYITQYKAKLAQGNTKKQPKQQEGEQ